LDGLEELERDLEKLAKEYERKTGNKIHGPNCPCAPRPSLLSVFGRTKPQKNCLFHRWGHIIDAVAGDQESLPGGGRRGISQAGIGGELRYIYNDVNNDSLNEARREQKDVRPEEHPSFQGISPETRGYSGWEIEAELMAEAIRVYLQNPNYVKTVGPNVAKRIRAAVNPHPVLKFIIQFN
jgi:hypothetical protein